MNSLARHAARATGPGRGSMTVSRTALLQDRISAVNRRTCHESKLV